ncbi:MAG: TatD family hydrolase [Candidatus Doudnabacteria bacterium]|nr:TatD family hydrolase [Candidatus Doudnabacteria bacterium]
MLFDTHTHVNFAAFKDDRDEVIKRALAENTWLINVGTQADTSKTAVDLAAKYPEGVYAAIGLHPVHTWQQMLDEEESHFKTREEHFDTTLYQSMITDKVVAVGECGLDYFRLREDNKEKAIELQKQAFVAQINFAKKHKLSLVVHCRDAYDDLLEVLKSEYAGMPAVIHSFTDTWETAKKFLDQGYYIALNGILTFDKSGRLAEVVKSAPFDRILTETDAPYLTPPPHRGKRNEPAYVRYVAIKIAEIKGLDTEEVMKQTFENACRLFNIKAF